MITKGDAEMLPWVKMLPTSTGNPGNRVQWRTDFTQLQANKLAMV